MYLPLLQQYEIVVHCQPDAYCDTEGAMKRWAEECWRQQLYPHRRCVFFIDHGTDFKRHMREQYRTEVEYVRRDSVYTALYFAATKKFKDELRFDPGDHNELIENIAKVHEPYRSDY